MWRALRLHACGVATRSKEIKAYVAANELAAATLLEEMFRQRLSLRNKVGRRYLGVLPRMVLVSLGAWDRPDFRDHLRLLPWPNDAEIARWSPQAGQAAESRYCLRIIATAAVAAASRPGMIIEYQRPMPMTLRTLVEPNSITTARTPTMPRIGGSMQLFGAAKAVWAWQEPKRLTEGVQGV